MARLFEHLLRAERFMPPKGRRGDFEVPLLGEVQLGSMQEPLLATNARGGFVPTRMSRTGSARYGFSVCPVEEESSFIPSLFVALARMPAVTRCSDVRMAVAHLRGFGSEARVIVVSSMDAADILGRDVSGEGFVGDSNGMMVVVANLPRGSAMVAVGPEHLGSYTRVGSYLGMLFHRVDRNVVVVDALAR
jgi:hypothetical protein